MYITFIKQSTRLFCVLFLTLVYGSFSAFSQDGTTLSGKVISQKNNQALGGASISVQGSTNAVVANNRGEFKITTFKQLPVELSVSFEGYQTKVVPVNNNEPIIIELEESAAELNDVVVVGYGTQRKADLTGSVSKIAGGEIKKIPVASFDAQMQGRAAGVQVISNSGVPGEAAFVRVRGTTSINSSSDPLYIIDGVFLNNTPLQSVNLGGRVTSPLADINPADIESIEILKDASATAIYGSRGANGVVIVTTKKGNYNAKPQINFNFSNGWVQADPSTLPPIATGPQTAELANEFWINSGSDNPALNRTFANRPFRPRAEGGQGLPEEQPTFDRVADLLRKGYLQDYNIALQGGSNNSRYYFGAGFTSQDAMIKVITFRRASLKFNYDQRLSDKIKFGITNNLSRSYRNQARTGDGPQVSLWNSAVSTAPYTPKFTEEGVSVGSDNTYILIDNYDTKTISLRYIGSVYGEAELAKDLKFRSSFSLDYNHYDEAQYWNTNTSIGRAAGGQAYSGITQNSTWINEQTLTYQRKFGKHNLNLLAGNTLQSNTIWFTGAQGQGFANDNFRLISSASVQTASQDWTRSTISSFFGRAAYNFANKYFAELTTRADASSKFGANNRWGYFPAFSAGWRLSEENFLKDVSWLDDLKIRGSYGSTGNQAGINDFAARGLWSGGSSYADVAGSPLPGIGPQQLGNSNLRWEKTAQTDLGLDVSLFKKRLSITFDVYNKYTTDLLLQQPIPSATGFSSYWENIGEISNKGFELTLNTIKIRKKDFSWSTGINISSNINKIEKLPTQITRYTRDWVIMKEGYSMNSFWLYNQLSVDPANGRPVFEGQDANGNVTTENRQILNNFYPRFYGGINNNISYKNFEFSAAFSFQEGNYSLNLQRYFRERNPLSGSIFTNMLNRWQRPGDITDVPRLTSVGNNYTIDQNSRYLEDASFIRLRQLSLNYHIPEKVLSSINIKDATLYFVGTNLFLWSKYTGDPESNVTSDPTAQGLGNFGTPPQPRGFQFGVNITL